MNNMIDIDETIKAFNTQWQRCGTLNIKPRISDNAPTPEQVQLIYQAYYGIKELIQRVKEAEGDG